MWDLIKRIFHFISTVIFYSIMFIVAIILIMVALYFFDQFQAKKSGQTRAPLFGSYIIITDSMVPSINPGDAVITMRVDIEDLKKTDVITFISTEHNSVTVTHRIMGIFDNEKGEYAFRTKGDHNNVEDDELVTYDRIIGKVILVIPYIGYLQQFLTQGSGWFLLIVIPCLWIIISDIIKLIKKSSKENDNINENKSNKNLSIDKKENKQEENKKEKLQNKVIPLIDDEIKVISIQPAIEDEKIEQRTNDYVIDNSNGFNNDVVKPSIVNLDEILEEENDETNNNSIF